MSFPGILAATFATFAWGLNFIVPFITQGYTIFDFALVQFLTAGIAAGVFVAIRHRHGSAVSMRDWLTTLSLGIVGYPAYFICLDGAAIYAGPLVAPAILALVPIALAILGNARQRTVGWSSLIGPLALSLTGLILVQMPLAAAGPRDPRENVMLGVPFAVGGVACWTLFGLGNQLALERRPTMDARLWTALIVVGAGVGVLAFFPLGNAFDLFALTQLGHGWQQAGALYAWAAGFGLVTTIGGALAWTLAVQRLPAALSAQMIVLEPVFGTVMGLLVHQRLPTLPEAAGLAALLAGVIAAIRIFNSVPQ